MYTYVDTSVVSLFLHLVKVVGSSKGVRGRVVGVGVLLKLELGLVLRLKVVV